MKVRITCDDCGRTRVVEIPTANTEEEAQKVIDMLNEEGLLDHRCNGIHRLDDGTSTNR